MASKSSSIALFFIFNFLVITLVVSEDNTAPSEPPSTSPPPPPPPRPLLLSRAGSEACPRDALKLGVCANVLTKLLSVSIGTPPKEPCCPIIRGILDLEAAVCLCTAIKANVLGINLVNIPVSVSLLVNHCGSKVPRGFQCR